MRSRLVHVGVRATNLTETLRFWRDGLGLTVVQETPDHSDLTDGWHNFRVFQHGGPERPPHVSGMLDYLHIGIRVDDLANAATRLQALGFEIIWDGVDGGQPYDPQSPPSESFKIADPDGIVVDVSANPDQWPGVDLEGKRQP
ncbi:MAG: VOC family protein [Thermomicrobiales bacterium]|nr:VOC family protein [Thermomicrobiales bacterium]MCO5220950.1 VOC family protein [Thermomicrobiales bacterium]